MRILVVDDEPGIRFALTELLSASGHELIEAEHAPQALALLDNRPVDLVLTDLKMPKVSGLELLQEIRRAHPHALVALITAHGDERTAVQALKLGAYDYIPKPFDNDEVRALVERAREVLSLREENARLREELATELHGLIGRSPPIREVFRFIRRAGRSDATVLVIGESGTGKELVARALHNEGARRTKPFMAVNCSAIPSELVESELFGHRRGAFTGAVRDHRGLFEAADGGTLFLDEIGDLALPAQAKVLRALEAREILPVGATRATTIDVRVIAATNRPLDMMVSAGAFRADLLYRLQVITLTVPPLRERREDIAPLAFHFLDVSAREHGREVRALTDEARRALLTHEWPGNVRELRNAIERAVVLAEGDSIALDDLPAHVAGTPSSLVPADAVTAELSFAEARRRAGRAFDRAFLRTALERYAGNISQTARAIGVHRQTLQKLLARLDVRAPADTDAAESQE
jgi:two-component system, NtrC family, response regulator HydG